MPLGMEVRLSQGDFVLDGDPASLIFRPMFIIVTVISLEHCTMHSRYWFVQVQVQVYRKKFNRTGTQSVPLCTVAPQYSVDS